MDTATSLIISHTPYFVFCIFGIIWLRLFRNKLKELNTKLEGDKK